MKKSFVLPTFILLAGLVVFFCSSSNDKIVPVPLPATMPASEPEAPVENSFTKSDIENFVEKFYSTLELSDEMNQRAFDEDLPFNTNAFYKCVNSQSIYSKVRLSNLTGDNHTYYRIGLKSIDSFSLNSNVYEVYTTVQYTIFELGTIQNIEKLTITNTGSSLVIAKWEDVRVKSMEIAEYDGLENYKETDFYKDLGSINK